MAHNSTVLIASKNKQNPDVLQCKTRTSTVCSELENSLNEQASLTYSRYVVIRANRINSCLSSRDATFQSPSATFWQRLSEVLPTFLLMNDRMSKWQHGNLTEQNKAQPSEWQWLTTYRETPRLTRMPCYKALAVIFPNIGSLLITWSLLQ